MSEWISVKDRMPEVHKPYLVADSQHRVCVREYFGGGQWSRDKYDITHWMPLPEPPEEANL